MNGERWREGGKARQRNFCLVWRCMVLVDFAFREKKKFRDFEG
jgi:hypothetical protein